MVFPGVYDIKEQEQEDELEKCRQNAAANFPVSGLTVILSSASLTRNLLHLQFLHYMLFYLFEHLCITS